MTEFYIDRHHAVSSSVAAGIAVVTYVQGDAVNEVNESVECLSSRRRTLLRTSRAVLTHNQREEKPWIK